MTLNAVGKISYCIKKKKIHSKLVPTEKKGRGGRDGMLSTNEK